MGWYRPLKTLYLLRHAKSSWDDPLLADHERPLAPRGREAAARIAVALARKRPRPAIVLCSSAVRARQTLAAVAPAAGASADVRTLDTIYGASAGELLELLRQLPDRVAAVLVVGHNPGMQDLAIELTGDGDPAVLRRLHEKFPTGALATLATDGTWAELAPGRARLESLIRPRDLFE